MASESTKILHNFGDNLPKDSAGEVYITLEGTVATGLESLAREECIEKLGKYAVTSRGRVFFGVVETTTNLPEILELKSVENVYLVAKSVDNADVYKEDALENLNRIVDEVDWEKYVSQWAKLIKYDVSKIDFSRKQPVAIKGTESEESAKETTLDEKDGGVKTIESKNESSSIESKPFSFRVTCNRSGKGHKFSSQDGARSFGGAMYDRFNWKVSMKEYDMEVVLSVNDDHVYIAFAVTREPLHKRNLVDLGPTSLKPTIAYSMLRLAQIKEGDVVCDPMCGGGTIPIEAADNWKCATICGDNHSKAWERVITNVTAFNAKLDKRERLPIALDVFKWDATMLPLRCDCIDVIITDLPFGKRMGDTKINAYMYPKFFRESARVARLDKARLVVLTQDKKNLITASRALARYWRQIRFHSINIGGLAGGVYLFKRTDLSYI